ncbi:hypothetical protein F0562_002415 [Nyssa sinensis]|uniref:CRIB domain-containing protein n=1 Tax=Nyssa sinensis TaxID=561372 RepID=A0A5J5CAR0_9ASTE|nr:hypothetical protein F0562_002415 [Nyssa sinensis]
MLGEFALFVADDEKEPEMQIGFPTDVKHVAHIGWDGPAVDSPSWMKDFNSPPGFQSGPLNINQEVKDNPEIKWVSEDSRRTSSRAQNKAGQRVDPNARWFFNIRINNPRSIRKIKAIKAKPIHHKGLIGHYQTGPAGIKSRVGLTLRKPSRHPQKIKKKEIKGVVYYKWWVNKIKKIESHHF